MSNSADVPEIPHGLILLTELPNGEPYLPKLVMGYFNPETNKVASASCYLTEPHKHARVNFDAFILRAAARDLSKHVNNGPISKFAYDLRNWDMK